MTKFLHLGNPLLRQMANKVDSTQINSSEIRKVTTLMMNVIKGERRKRKKGVGLAAPQIGISKRIILVDVAADGKGKLGNIRVFINPQITWASKRRVEWYEGCFSTGQICGIVSRPLSIKLEAQNLDGKFVKEKYTGYIARIFQHEIDHLNGKVFIERIKDSDKLHKVTKREFPQYRKNWRNWSKKYPLPLALRKLKKV